MMLHNEVRCARVWIWCDLGLGTERPGTVRLMYKGFRNHLQDCGKTWYFN